MKNNYTRTLERLTEAYQNAQEGPGRKKIATLIQDISQGRIKAAEIDDKIRELEEQHEV